MNFVPGRNLVINETTADHVASRSNAGYSCVTTDLLPQYQYSARFLRATAYMLSAHMLSQFRLSVCLSVRLSVTRVDQSKTVEVRIIQ